MKALASMTNFELLSLLLGKVKAEKLSAVSLPELFGLCAKRHAQQTLFQELPVYEIDQKLAASKILMSRAMEADLMRNKTALNSPGAVKEYLRLLIGGLQYEVFVAIFLDTQHRIIVTQEMFRGTLSQTSVYPREVVKAALAHNSAAVIFAHNHPSGICDPSQSDQLLTSTLKQALSLVDVRVLDHIIVGETSTLSFAEKGLI